MKRKIICGIVIILIVIMWIAVIVSGNVLSLSPFIAVSIFPFVMAILLYCKEEEKKPEKRGGGRYAKIHKT